MAHRSIPFFSLNTQIKSNEQDLLKIFAETLATQQFVGGPVVESFEKKLAQYLGISHVISCNSGTDALLIALKALGVHKNSIVLTTPFSFIASSSEIVTHGAVPVFIDIDEQTFNINPKKMRAWLEQNAAIRNGSTIHLKTGIAIEGIITVDLFGQCADYKAIKEIAEEWGLWIIEDTCQAIGASYDSHKAGTFGNIGVFSFYPTKNLGAFGDGGCLTTDDPQLAERIRKIRNHGRKNHYEYEELGVNSRLDALQAAILSYKLDRLDGYNDQRRSHANRYEKNLGNSTFITLPKEITGKHVYHQYCIKIAEHNGMSLQKDLQQHLTEHGIGTNIFYPKPLSHIAFLNANPALKTDCPVVDRVFKNILALPIWPELEPRDIDYICDVIKQFPVAFARKSTKSSQVSI